MLSHLLTSGVIGLILGFGWSPTPRRFKELSAVIRLPVVVGTALVTSVVVGTLGVDNTPGIDWVELILGIVLSFLVALLAVGIVSKLSASGSAP